MGKHLVAGRHLKYLNLSRNEGIGNDGTKALVQFTTAGSDDATTFFPTLDHLDMSECELGADGAVALSECLYHGVRREAGRQVPLNLALNANPIGPEGVRALSNLLGPRSSLVSLSLASCKIENEGLKSLCEAIQSTGCVGLRVLDLSNNNIGIEGTTSLALTLWDGNENNFSTLKELRLSGNPLETEGLVTLMQSLGKEKNSVLQSLDFSKTRCGSKGAVAAVTCDSLNVVEAVQQQAWLRRVQGTSCGLEGWP